MRPERKALLLAKLRAFVAHLGISVAVFALFFAATVLLWLPPPYFWIDGGILVMGVAAVIDIVLGPALTFMVYRPARRGLVWNLAAIAFLQAAALTWGVKVLYEGRPIAAAYVGFTRKEFFPLTTSQLRDGPRPIETLARMSPERPPLVYIPLSRDMKEAREQVLGAFGSGTSVFRQSDRFRPLEGEVLAEVLAAGRSKAELESIWPDAGPRVDAYLTDSGRRLEDVALIPVYGRYSTALLALERKSGRIVGHVYLYAR